jgi:chromosome segregation protein
MHISKLRLLGFKSFVEPTELLIEQGLTGVVGPNGCGKSNLLEALRWCMGETSYKSMRASSMDDVIFNGTTQRPARNMAEVTMFIDNSARRAPAEFNDHDVLEVTRRIEREMGSAYRVNGRDARARDIKILFEDAATGARSPALVRQGQIAEIVNAKPEQRRRILEDAAGVAGLHSRRHEAELRLRAAEANLARLGDVIAQVQSQLESLKRQARQAKRYKELTEDIRKGEALLHHVLWLAIEADVAAEEAALAQALSAVAAATERESQLVTAEHDAATTLPALRDEEAKAAAALHRIKVEQENFEREAIRAARRLQELQDRSAQSKRDLQREEQLVAEARETLTRLASEKRTLDQTNGQASSLATKAQTAFATAEAAARNIEQRLSGLQTAAAEARARRKSLLAQAAERKDAATRIQRQVSALETQVREVAAAAPNAQRLAAATALTTQLQADVNALDEQALAADERFEMAAAEAAETREAAQKAMLRARELKTEVDTLVKLLKPTTHAAAARAVDQIAVETGYEKALAAALGEDLEAALDDASAMYWRLNDAPEIDPPLAAGIALLSDYVVAPKELERRLQQVGVVDSADGPALQRQLRAGQRLVSREGDLWRWDGFVASRAGTSSAALRLAERNRLDALMRDQKAAQKAADKTAAAAAKAAETYAATDALTRRLRAENRDAQTQLTAARDALTIMERAARETDQRLATATEARDAASEALVEANERLAEVDMQLEGLGESDPFEDQLTSAQEDAVERRQAVADARAELATLEREQRDRDARLQTIEADIERWTSRTANADEQLEIIRERIEAAEEEMLAAAELPDGIDEQRDKLLSALASAEKVRQNAADALAAADTAFRTTQVDLRAAQAAVGAAREGKARLEARLEAARQRRLDHVRKTQDVVGVVPNECLAVAEVLPEVGVPPIEDIEKTLLRAKTDRERLGGVNLAADDELEKASAQFGGLDKERLDVEEAIAKLRGGIGDLNKEAKQRLRVAFDIVNGHFQKLFGILFNGGEARLEMIESETDPLEGGLEIIAKPPGKKPATLSLLSGGEQTLTALSLIFAVFLTNPSPICVLDEVDAPLDDANVDRFCTMMERMAADTATRFLVITHHPMTMARMNRLFGVTMAEKGVSQLVSVDLELARKFVEDEAA